LSAPAGAVGWKPVFGGNAVRFTANLCVVFSRLDLQVKRDCERVSSGRFADQHLSSDTFPVKVSPNRVHRLDSLGPPSFHHRSKCARDALEWLAGIRRGEVEGD
jgi:hypothetical protein